MIIENESSFNSRLRMANPMSDKILIMQLLPKMFLANQIAGFFEM